LRHGKDHCQNGTVPYLLESIKLAKTVTDIPLLVRMDSGNDSRGNLVATDDQEYPVNLTYVAIERTILTTGQILLMPEVEIETYWTTLNELPETIVELYHNHGTVIQNLITCTARLIKHSRRTSLGFSLSNKWFFLTKSTYDPFAHWQTNRLKITY
jgi:hypothetical protein